MGWSCWYFEWGSYRIYTGLVGRKLWRWNKWGDKWKLLSLLRFWSFCSWRFVRRYSYKWCLVERIMNIKMDEWLFRMDEGILKRKEYVKWVNLSRRFWFHIFRGWWWWVFRSLRGWLCHRHRGRSSASNCQCLPWWVRIGFPSCYKFPSREQGSHLNSSTRFYPCRTSRTVFAPLAADLELSSYRIYLDAIILGVISG